MPIATVISRRDPRDGFTLHEVELQQWINSENISRLDAGDDLMRIEAMSTVLEPERITTMLAYR